MRQSPLGPAQQPSLFGVAATDPAPGDLAGLLAGPGEVQRMGGTARVVVPADAAWRVHVLVAELTARGLPASWREDGPGGAGAGRDAGLGGAGGPGTGVVGQGTRCGYVVRTAYSARLMPLARAWRDGPPAGLHLAGHPLRLWVAAAGAPSPDGYLLGLAAGADRANWSAVGAALAAAGLAAALLVPGDGDPAYRITGRKRLARLAELVGAPPPAAPPRAWP